MKSLLVLCRVKCWWDFCFCIAVKKKECIFCSHSKTPIKARRNEATEVEEHAKFCPEVGKMSSVIAQIELLWNYLAYTENMMLSCSLKTLLVLYGCIFLKPDMNDVQLCGAV